MKFNKSFIKNIIGILAAFFVFLAIAAILNYMYASPNLENRIMWKSFYSQDRIDTIFLGSSLVFCGIDVQTAEEVLSATDEKVFDLSTGSQRLHEAYYNLREADRKYDIKNVYLELDSMLETYSFGDYGNTFVKTSSWTDTDYMQLSLNKICGVYDINGSDFLIQALFPFTRYRAYLFDKKHIQDNLAIKRSDDYKNYTYRGNYPDGNGCHETDLDAKGCWNTTRVLENPVCIQAQKREQMRITEDAKKYLQKIIQYCNKHNISITLFMSPMYETTPISTENYDLYFTSVREIADEYCVALYDFNLVKEEYLNLSQDEYFDVSHLNSRGAEKFTSFFMQLVLKEKLSSEPVLNEQRYNTNDKQAYFYSSFEDKLKYQNPRVYGVYFNNMTDRVKMHIAASEKEDMEFKVTFKLNDENSNPTGPEEPLQEYCKNRDFQFPLNTHGMFTIYTKMKNDNTELPPVECIY